MGQVTVYDAETMAAIRDSAIVNGEIDPATGHLMLTRFDETEVDAGLILTSPRVVTSGTRPVGAALFDGLTIYETDTDRFYVYNGAAWIPRGQGTFICTLATRPAAPFEGLAIYETDTDRFLYYTGSSWRQQDPRSHPTAVRGGAVGQTIGGNDITAAAWTTGCLSLSITQPAWATKLNWDVNVNAPIITAAATFDFRLIWVLTPLQQINGLAVSPGVTPFSFRGELALGAAGTYNLVFQMLRTSGTGGVRQSTSHASYEVWFT